MEIIHQNLVELNRILGDDFLNQYSNNNYQRNNNIPHQIGGNQNYENQLNEVINTSLQEASLLDYNANTKLNAEQAQQVIYQFKLRKGKKDDKCPICLEEGTEINTCVILPCCSNKQIICIDCFKNTLQNVGPTCPTCRKNMITELKNYKQTSQGKKDFQRYIQQLNSKKSNKGKRNQTNIGNSINNTNKNTKKNNKKTVPEDYHNNLNPKDGDYLKKYNIRRKFHKHTGKIQYWVNINSNDNKPLTIRSNIPYNYQISMNEFLVDYKKKYQSNIIHNQNVLWDILVDKSNHFRAVHKTNASNNDYRNFIQELRDTVNRYIGY